jgi:hypothetical protein
MNCDRQNAVPKSRLKKPALSPGIALHHMTPSVSTLEARDTPSLRDYIDTVASQRETLRQTKILCVRAEISAAKYAADRRDGATVIAHHVVSEADAVGSPEG